MSHGDFILNRNRDTEEGLRALIDWASHVRVGDIPRPVLGKMGLVIMDNIGATVAAREEPEVTRAYAQLDRFSGPREATVFRGGRPRLDRYSAALANGIAQSWCELDEGHGQVSCHAGLYTLPALLAEAEARELTVAQLLRAAVIGYEIVSRVARCWTPKPLTIHLHSAYAAIGSAAACSAGRELDAKHFLDAVTAAASLINVGHWQHATQGALARNVWAAVGGQTGMRCADWAECGIGGLMAGPYLSYTELLGIEPQPKRLTMDLGREWAVSQSYQKIYACCRSTHSAAEAMIDAVAKMPSGKSAENVERITLETHRPAMSNPRPATTLAAKFSFEHVLATSCVHGHASADAFAATTLTSAPIARLRERVELLDFAPLPSPPNDRPARLTIELDDGQTLVSECLSAQGAPDRPWDEAVILSKATELTGQVYPRFVATMSEVMAVSAMRMEQRWAETVADFTNQTP